MHTYPNFRVAVEAVILHHGRVLLTKRAGSEGSLGPWGIPAGKARYEEVPAQALIREAKEETGLDVEIIRVLDVRTFSDRWGEETVYRLVFTYLAAPIDGDIRGLALNDEHSEYAWIERADLDAERYQSIRPNLRAILIDVLERGDGITKTDCECSQADSSGS